MFLILHIGGHGIVASIDTRLDWLDTNMGFMNNGLGLIIAIFVLMMLAVWLFAAAPDAKADRYKNEAQEEPAPVYGLIYVLRSHYHFERGRDRLLRSWLNLVGIFTVVGHNFSWVLAFIRRDLGIKV